MPNRVQWDEAYATGDTTLDEQYRGLLAQCNALADCLPDNQADATTFQKQFDAVLDYARQLFAFEQTRLADCPLLGEHNDEIDEFEFLAADIITEENFDPIEVQRFLALWCVGHIAGFGKNYRDFQGK